MLAVVGVVIYLVDRTARHTRTFRHMRMSDALLIGVAQAVALQPGVSRSGITITAARGLGFERERAARFSFLLSLPIIGGAGPFQGGEGLFRHEKNPHSLYRPVAVGGVASAAGRVLVALGP